MRVFVCEFITGGGCAGTALPASLAREGGMMLSALVDDLLRLPGLEVSIAQDPRIDLKLPNAVRRTLLRDADPWPIWQAMIKASDATWPIAPEIGGALERLSRTVLTGQRLLLGSGPEAIAVAASKSASARVLSAAGIAAIACYTPDDKPPASPQGWIVKPDDGAGSEDTCFFDDLNAARAYCRHTRNNSIIQAYVDGQHLSLSLLCRNGTCTLLSCNEQMIQRHEGRLTLAGIRVNIPSALGHKLTELANAVARALPGLWGYVGLDIILAGEDLMVVDINPRLTTAYVGLHKLLDTNLAGAVLDLLDPTLPIRAISPPVGTVQLDLQASNRAPPGRDLAPGYTAATVSQA
jgi:predicted ATP-grasp superfamily ATP-dependent carboligase